MEVVAYYFHLGEKSVHFRSIIESVDSICRDSTDTQYMIIQVISQNHKNSKIIYKQHTILLQAFSWSTTCLVAQKSTVKVLNQKVAKQPIYSFSSSDRLVQNCVTSSHFCTKQQHFTMSSAPAHCFLKFHQVVQTGHWRTMASFATALYVCT